MTFNLGEIIRLEPVVAFALTDGYEQYSVEMGVFGVKNLSKFNALYGVRLGLSSMETKVIAPTIGGEYYFIKHFSIGSEVQIRGLITEEDKAFLTNTAVIVRFYF